MLELQLTSIRFSTRGILSMHKWLKEWAYHFAIVTRAYISLSFPLSQTLTTTTTKQQCQNIPHPF